MYKVFDIGALTNDANGIFADQTLGDAGDLTLDGDLVVDGVAYFAYAQIVSIEGTGNNSGITFTVYGTDADGNDTSQTITGANNGTAKTTIHFLTVNRVAASAAITGNVEGGVLAADGMVTKSYPCNRRQSPFNMSLCHNLTAGTMTVSAQYTLDNPQGEYSNGFANSADWRGVDGLSAVTADAVSNLAYPVTAVRFIQTVGSTTGTARQTVIQGQNG
jgi:hypothetical protein